MRHVEAKNLGELLEQLATAGEGDTVSVEDMLEATGRRSFGPVLLVAGIVAVSPLSGIPGMPTTMAIAVVLVAGQLLLGRRAFWLPRWLLRQHFTRRRFEKMLGWFHRPACFVDRHLLRPRLEVLTRGAASYAVALACTVVALTMPPLEVVPFAATTAGVALMAFALALMANDGLLLLVALLFVGGAVTLAVRHFLG